MGAIVYGLCTVAALGCAFLIFRAYVISRTRLLLWAGLCFAMLALNNALVVVDLVVFPEVNLFILRNAAAFIGVWFLLFGLVWEAK